MSSAPAPKQDAESSPHSTAQVVTAAKPGNNPKLWTVKDAVLFLRISERKLREMLRTPETENGSLPHVRLGRSPRFIPADIEEWAACGFPPAAVFKAWKNSVDRRRKRNDIGTFLEKQEN